MELAVGGLTELLLVKFGWPTTTSAGWLLRMGIEFQISTRLLSVSAITRWMPSEATAVGLRSPLCVAFNAGSVVVKSGWPRTIAACPTHAGQRCWYCSSSLGAGSCPETLV